MGCARLRGMAVGFEAARVSRRGVCRWAGGQEGGEGEVWMGCEVTVAMAVVGGHRGGLDRTGWRWDGPAGRRRPM